MAVNSTKKITELDFDEIRTNLQTFLEGQDRFKDYDFNGSGLSVLLDILSYNTHYSSFYANMVANDMFLDSATRRESVVSHAKQIGYVPHSKRSSECRVQLTFSTSDSDSITILPRTEFIASVNGNDYYFYNTETLTIDTTGDAPYVSDTFSIYEGTYKTISYVVSNNAETEYVIPSFSVDTDRMFVSVLESTSSSTGNENVWTKVTDITSVTSTSKVYFLNQTSTGFYYIKFGDNILGQKLSDGNVVVIRYLETSGDAANGIGRSDTTTNRVFSTTLENATVSVVTPASGGADAETIQSIKENSPLFYQTQDRAVTKNDYKSLTLSQYGNSDDVLVFGGEDFSPPQYGKVFVCIKPSSGGILTEDQKQDVIRDIYSTKNVVGIIPEIIDPEYTYLLFNAQFDYDSTLTTLQPTALKALITIYLSGYASTNLSKFGKNLYINKLEELCRGLDSSLLYVDVDVKLQKRIAPVLNKVQNYTINYQNTILNTAHDAEDGINGPPAVQSTNFAYRKANGTVFLAAIDCDMNGNLRIYEEANRIRTTIFSNIGSVDFVNGIVTINNFAPLSSTRDGTIRFNVTPREDVVKTVTNNILTFDSSVTNAVNVMYKQTTSNDGY